MSRFKLLWYWQEEISRTIDQKLLELDFESASQVICSPDESQWDLFIASHFIKFKREDKYTRSHKGPKCKPVYTWLWRGGNRVQCVTLRTFRVLVITTEQTVWKWFPFKISALFQSSKKEINQIHKVNLNHKWIMLKQLYRTYTHTLRTTNTFITYKKIRREKPNWFNSLLGLAVTITFLLIDTTYLQS